MRQGLLLRAENVWLLVAALLSGLGAYGFQFVATRTLGETAFAPVGVLWTSQFLVVSVLLLAVEAYVVRLTAGSHRRRLRELVTATGPWLIGSTLVVGIILFFARDALFLGHGDLWIPGTVSTLTYGVFVVARGTLAGSGEFSRYATVTALDGLGRVLFALFAVGLATPLAFAWAMPLAPLLGLLAIRRKADGHATELSEPPPSLIPATTRFLGLAAAGNAVAQTLLASWPLVLVALKATPNEVALGFVTLTIARAPLVLAFNGLLSRVLGPLTRMEKAQQGARLRKLALLITVGTGATAVLAAAATGLAGPALLAIVFGEGFRPPWWLAAAAAAGAMISVGGFLLHHVMIARSQELWLAPAWGCGIITAGMSLFLWSGEPLERIAIAFVVGEVSALAAMCVATQRINSPSSSDGTATAS